MVTFEQILYIIPILALAASIIYYALTIRNQNKTRQAQLILNIYNRMDADWLEAFQIVMRADFTNYQEYHDKYSYDANPEYKRIENTISTFFEGLGTIVREGLLDIRFIASMQGGTTRRYWEKMAPIVKEGRVVGGYPRWLSETEYLYDELMKYMKEHSELAT